MKRNEPLTIEYFCQDITQLAEDGKLDPLVGREKEITRIIHILSRRIKNNPLLVGDPGVGKTALVYGLAGRIAEGNVPERLAGKRIFSLDLGLLISGTVFRGEFEARLKDILKDLEQTNAILFIDELHNIVGAGSAQGSLDAANILKPYLSQGKIQCIGATTTEEYRKYIEKDKALERRFQQVLIDEPNEEESIAILQKVSPLYEEHHGIVITKEAIEYAVKLSNRYIRDRFLPDKALDLLDEAASRTANKNVSPLAVKKRAILEKKKRELLKQKEEAIQNEDYESALSIKQAEQDLSREIHTLSSSSPLSKETSEGRARLTANDLIEQIEEITGIPSKKLDEKESRKWNTLEKTLQKNIIGQTEAMRIIAKTIKRNRAGIGDARRPIGSFLLLGPTGVGKTETARVLADILSSQGKQKKNKNNLIKLDMSEFSESHSVSKLIGAPPGYVGFEDGVSQLEEIRKNPYSVVLFDEIEKAHPQLYNLLLQILEDGELTTSAGRTISFKNAVIIMTSNIGSSEFNELNARLGFRENKEKAHTLRRPFEETKDNALKELKTFMRPELLSRIDHVIVFSPLEKKTVRKIVGLRLKDLQERMPRFTLTFAENTIDFLTDLSTETSQGARLVRNVIQTHLEDPLSEKILNGSIQEGDVITVSFDKKRLLIQK